MGEEGKLLCNLVRFLMQIWEGKFLNFYVMKNLIKKVLIFEKIVILTFLIKNFIFKFLLKNYLFSLFLFLFYLHFVTTANSATPQ
jgi:hypothetical protein